MKTPDADSTASRVSAHLLCVSKIRRRLTGDGHPPSGLRKARRRLRACRVATRRDPSVLQTHISKSEMGGTRRCVASAGVRGADGKAIQSLRLRLCDGLRQSGTRRWRGFAASFDFAQDRLTSRALPVCGCGEIWVEGARADCFPPVRDEAAYGWGTQSFTGGPPANFDFVLEFAPEMATGENTGGAQADPGGSRSERR